jgi:hypothetical protein
MRAATSRRSLACDPRRHRLTLEALAQLGEFIGAVAVVVSLAYLAYQVRQNTHSLRSENYARAHDRVAAVQARLGDPSQARVFGRAVWDPGTLSPAERIQFAWALYEMFGAFEFMYHQAQAGALPPEVWERWAATLGWWTSLPGVQAWWRSKPAPFSASFTRFVEDGLERGTPDPEAALRWQEFLTGQRSA